MKRCVMLMFEFIFVAQEDGMEGEIERYIHDTKKQGQNKAKGTRRQKETQTECSRVGFLPASLPKKRHRVRYILQPVKKGILAPNRKISNEVRELSKKRSSSWRRRKKIHWCVTAMPLNLQRGKTDKHRHFLAREPPPTAVMTRYISANLSRCPRLPLSYP